MDDAATRRTSGRADDRATSAVPADAAAGSSPASRRSPRRRAGTDVLLAGVLIAAAAVTTVPGCGEPGDPPPPRPQTPDPPAPRDSAWTLLESGVVVAASDTDDRLRAAVERARDEVEEARARWRSRRDEAGAPEAGWYVKWAAPTVDGPIEAVWVAVDAWTEHRIEGRLASVPIRRLLVGRAFGERVALPAGELVDWMYDAGNDGRGPFDGGYTVPALEAVHGPMDGARPRPDDVGAPDASDDADAPSDTDPSDEAAAPGGPGDPSPPREPAP